VGRKRHFAEYQSGAAIHAVRQEVIWEEMQADISPAGIPVDGSRDPQKMCDPMGFRRLFAFNYGFELLQTAKTVEFFEWSHRWRTIWTDGRKLPPNPPQSRFYGLCGGPLGGHTFVVGVTVVHPKRSWPHARTSCESTNQGRLASNHSFRPPGVKEPTTKHSS
jgi:hypothetical protein